MYEIRLRRLLIGFVCLLAALATRAFYVQVAAAKDFTERMTSERHVRPGARRGTVYWADGTPMAVNTPGYGLEIVWREFDDRLLPTVEEFERAIRQRVAAEIDDDERALEAETLVIRRERLRAEQDAARARRGAWRAKLSAMLGELRAEHLRGGVAGLWLCRVCDSRTRSVKAPTRPCPECGVEGEFEESTPVELDELASLLETDRFGVYEEFVLALDRKGRKPSWRSHAFRVLIPAYAAEAISLEPRHFGGFELLPRSSREVDPLAAQIVGSTRLPSPADFVALQAPERVSFGLHRYTESEIYPLRIGASLIERVHDEDLRGAPGHIVRRRDPDDDFAWKDDVLRTVRDGADLHTTLRRGLQETALRIVETAAPDRHAAAVVMDVRDGSILALASTDRDGMNHARCPVVPGSVYKLVTAVAGLEAGLPPDHTQLCRRRGRVQGGGRYVCEHDDGNIALVDAFAHSCNGFFAQQAAAAGVDAMVSAATRLGLAEQHLLGDLGPDQSRAAGLLLSGPERRTWYAPDLAFIGIGQGYASASPVQIATAYARVASGGRMVRPWLLLRNQPAPGSIALDPVLSQWASVLRAGARDVVTSGTADQVPGLQELAAAGKTGTAEVDRVVETGETVRTVNAWFVGYAPHDAPRYCAVVVFEGLPSGEQNYGGKIAGPSVAELLAEALRE